MSQASQPPAPGLDIDRLLAMATELARSGNGRGAHALFFALTREHPEDTRPWLGLAAVAASPDERRLALERVLALDPNNAQAQLALQRLFDHDGQRLATTAADEHAPPAPLTLPDTTATLPAAMVAGSELSVSAPAEELQEEESARTPFPLLNAIMTGIILLLLAILGVLIGRALLDGNRIAAAPTVTAPLVVQPGGAADVAVTSIPVATSAPPPTATVRPTQPPATPPANTPVAAAVAPTPATTPTPTAPPASPTPPVALPLGTIVDHDGWSATLLRPDYAVTLDGAIGDLRPSGRFVLTVVAVSNNSPEPRTIPSDMFVLRDDTGRAFSPVPGASSAYLALYERAQRGDLALEDGFDPNSGMRSVPLLFDVPPEAGGLQLIVSGAGPTGWPVGTSDIPPGTGP